MLNKRTGNILDRKEVKNWQKVQIRDIAKTNSSSYNSKDDWKYINYLDTGSITQNVVSEIQYIDLNIDKLPSRAKRKVRYNSIIYSTVRPIQQHFGIIKTQPSNFLVSTGFTVIDVDETKVDADFIYFYLSQKSVTEKLNAIAEQSVSTYPAIKAKDLEDIEIDLPPLSVQKQISTVLKSISDKMELNTAINNNLEAIAFATFNHKFPNISKGENTIGDMITPKRGKNLLSKDAIFGPVPVVAGGLEPATYHNISNTKAPVLAISASGANAGYISIWNIPIWSADSSYIDATMTNDVYFWYIFLKQRQKEIFDSQIGSAQPHIYPKHIAGMSMRDINLEEIDEYTEQIKPLFELIGKNKEQNAGLSTLRNTLLPKLMSGKLEISSIYI